MSGYNVTFETVFEGTLCGRWPDTGVWLCLLAMRDKNGHVDKTPEFVAAITGIPLQTLLECIERFCAPDPRSRTKTDDGRRLRLIDPEKPWGWAVINHLAYGEKARLVAKNRREVDSGNNAGRMSDRRGPPGTAGDRPEPPVTPSLNSQLSTATEEVHTAPAGRSKSSNVQPTEFEQEVIDAYHSTLPDHPKVKAWTRKRRQLLSTRIADANGRGKCASMVGYWRQFFAHVAKSDFLCGRAKTDSPFVADLEWLLLPTNFLKVIEGRYAR